MFNITADFLGADEPDLEFIIIHVRDIRAAAHRDIKSCLRHFFDGGILQTALGQPKS